MPSKHKEVGWTACKIHPLRLHRSRREGGAKKAIVQRNKRFSVMHVTLLEGRNGSHALKHMEILGYTHRHPLFTREPAVTASAPQAPSFTRQLQWDIFEY